MFILDAVTHFFFILQICCFLTRGQPDKIPTNSNFSIHTHTLKSCATRSIRHKTLELVRTQSFDTFTTHLFQISKSN